MQMKKSLLLILLCSVTALGFAQTSKKGFSMVKEETKTMSQGVKNALTIEIPASAEQVENRWKNLMESYKSKPKWNRKEKEFFSDNAQITEINGNNPVDVYAKIEESGTSNTLLTVWFDLGGAYLNKGEHNEKFAFGEKMVIGFAKEVAVVTTQKALDDEEKKMKKADSKLKDLVDDKESLLKNIESYKAKIKKAEEDIIKNEQSQKEQQKQVEDQKEAVKKAKAKLEEASKA
jgi:hypothetical protein